MFFNNLCKNFETKKIHGDSLIKVPIYGANFGTLNFNLTSCGVSEQEQEFIFTIDQSGSMTDRCLDGRSKMQHIIHTLKNMILYFYNNLIVNLHVTVFAFDDNFVTIIERTQISATNLQEILTKVENIQPNGSTNIELALKETGEYITQLKADNPLHNVNHIFMTDGDATVGSNDHNVLKDLVDSSVENAFIGFGTNHDSSLLTHITNYRNSSYHFIDALEKAGLVYGEILHGILYKYLTDVEVSIENGLVYDFKVNQWLDKLFIGDISGEANKTYHLISNTPENCKIILSCKNLGEKYSFEVLELIDSESNHTKYIYRQKTLELLFEVCILQKNKIELQKLHHFSAFTLSSQENDDYHSMLKKNKNEENELKDKLHTFFKEIKKYMADNNLDGDNFFKNLCDDIYISHKTLGTTYGAMYSTARQTSQGTQRCYTVSHTPHDNEANYINDYPNTLLRTPRMSMQITKNFHTPNLFNEINVIRNNNISLINPNEIIHNLSSFEDAPYLTHTATRIMRDVSAGPNEFYVNPLEEISHI
jgi:hypothetical protein